MQDDGSYTEEHPRTSQEMVINLLNSSTKSLMGLTDSSTADDAFKQLYLANVLNGKSMVELTFLDSVSSKPLSGVIVTCDKFCDAAGTALTQHITDDNGKIIAFVSAINPTIKITGYADIEDFSQQLDVPALGKQFVFSFNLITNLTKRYISSSSFKLSGNVVKLDYTLVGGGGAGDIGQYYAGCYGGGNGGSGGQVVSNSLSEFIVNQSYTVTIGAGGTAREPTSYPYRPSKYSGRTDGGVSTFLRISATGGKFAGANNAGKSPYNDYKVQVKGGNGADGIPGKDYEFSSIKYGASGRGGSFSQVGQYLEYKAPGGNTGGRSGRSSSGPSSGFGTAGTNGTGSGGGGSGCCYEDDDGDNWYLSKSGAGGSGSLALVFSLTSRS